MAGGIRLKIGIKCFYFISLTLTARSSGRWFIGYGKKEVYEEGMLRVVQLIEVAMDWREVHCLAVCECFQLILYRKESRFGKSLLTAIQVV